MKKLINAIRTFFCATLWDTEFSQLGKCRRSAYALLRIVILAIRGFVGDKCTLQSSALTYITLVSIVPVLAVTLSFCKGIGLQKKLLTTLGIRPVVTTIPAENAGESASFEIKYEVIQATEEELKVLNAEMMESLDGQSAKDSDAPAVDAGVASDKISEAAEDEIEHHRPGIAAQLPEPMQLALVNVFGYVEKTNFAAIGIIGILTLLVTVIASIKKLENIFNKIWCVEKGRPIPRQFCEYLVVLIFMPIVLLCALSIHSFVASGELMELLHTKSALMMATGSLTARLLMNLFVIGAFTFLYLFMPNTKVRLWPALLGGLIATACFEAVFYAYTHWQVGLAKYNAIYGTFAALPFFLAWLYANWTVVLLGAEISYAAQNYRMLRMDKLQQHLEPGACHLLGIVIMNEICATFNAGNGAWNAGTYASNHSIPITELEVALAELKQAGLILQLNPEAPPPKRYDYMPSRPPELLTIKEVTEAFTRLDSEQARRIGKYLPENIRQVLIAHHERMSDSLDINFMKLG